MTRLFDWKARRAGGRITIDAKDEHGKPIKVVGVDVIEAGWPYPSATDKDGRAYELISQA